MTITARDGYTGGASEGVPERCPHPLPSGYPRAEARTQTLPSRPVRSAAVRSKRTTPKHVLRSEGRSEKGDRLTSSGLSFRFGMECLAHSGVGGDASRTTRPSLGLGVPERSPISSSGPTSEPARLKYIAGGLLLWCSFLSLVGCSLLMFLQTLYGGVYVR